MRSAEVEGYDVAPPGHTPRLYAGSEVVELSPGDELARTFAVVEKNMEAVGAS